MMPEKQPKKEKKKKRGEQMSRIASKNKNLISMTFYAQLNFYILL